MFVLHANAYKLKFIKKYLLNKGLHIEDSLYKDYIFTVRDPSPFLPAELKEGVLIKEFTEAYRNLLKKRTDIRMATIPTEQYKFGSPVKIVAGQYKGFTGLVVDATDKLAILVEIAVLGKIIKDTVKSSEIEINEYSSEYLSVG